MRTGKPVLIRRSGLFFLFPKRAFVKGDIKRAFNFLPGPSSGTRKFSFRVDENSRKLYHAFVWAAEECMNAE